MDEDTDTEYVKDFVLPLWKRNRDDENPPSEDEESLDLETPLTPISSPFHSVAERELSFLSNQSSFDKTSLRKNSASQHGILEALEERDVDSLYYHLQRGADPNYKYGIYLSSPLYLATVSKFTTAMDLLLFHNANVNDPDSRGITPLHIAASLGDENIVDKLLNAGAKVNCTNLLKPDGTGQETPLHTAALHGHLQIVLRLLDAGAEVNAIEARGRTPLHFAAQRGSADCIGALLKYGADANAMDYTGTTPLLLLGGSFVVKAPYGRSLRYAKSVHLLVGEGGANTEVRDQTTKVTPLHQAATIGNIGAITILVQCEVDICCQDYEGVTPLHISALKGHAAAVKVMLAATSGSKAVNIVDKCGRTALHKAAYRGSAECIQQLLKAGADLGARTRCGVSAVTLILRLPNGIKFLNQQLNTGISINNTNIGEYSCRLIFNYNSLLSASNAKQMAIIKDLLKEIGGARKAELFRHPLIESFLFFKWKKVRILFFFTFVIYLSLVVATTSFILCNQQHYPENETLDIAILALRFVILIIVSVIFLQEILQIGILRQYYLRELENWIKLIAITTSAILALSSSAEEWIHHLSAVAILSGWIEVTLLIGRLPAFGKYTLMFYSVAQQLVKFVVVFSFFLAGFAFSFHLMFIQKPAFANPWSAYLKTVAMLVGDMDFDGYFYDTENGHSPLQGTSHVIYLLFLIFVSLVLMNFLIGLAVNDIQSIKKNGIIYQSMKQAQFVIYLENMVHQRLLCFLLTSKLRKKLIHMIQQEPTVIIRPAVPNPPIVLADCIIERALTIAQERKIPNDLVTLSDVYSSIQDCLSTIRQFEERLRDIEDYLKGPAYSGPGYDTVDSDFSGSSHLLNDLDEVDGDQEATKQTQLNLQAQLLTIKNMLTSLTAQRCPNMELQQSQ